MILPDTHSTKRRDIYYDYNPAFSIASETFTPLTRHCSTPFHFRDENGPHLEINLKECDDVRARGVQTQQERRPQRVDRGMDNTTSSRKLHLSWHLTIAYVAYFINFDRRNSIFCFAADPSTRYLVDVYASADQQSRNWIETHQSTLRAARLTTYKMPLPTTQRILGNMLFFLQVM